MKVLQINSVYGNLSTGRIAMDLVNVQKENSIEPFVACNYSFVESQEVFAMNNNTLYNKFNILLTRLFGRHGFYNKKATARMLKYIDSVSPDIIHLHNIHGHYLNIEMLFEYIAKKAVPVVWTLHDCWSFTGHCSHFDYIGCDKWKSGCKNCPQLRDYPDTWFFDRSESNWKDKKRLFTSVEKMHVVTPSKWLADLAKQSYLSKYPISVIHNGIDTDSFAPVKADIKKRLGLDGKFVILGVVDSLEGYKGGQYFSELSKMLSEDEHIVLLSLQCDEDSLPHNITALRRTHSKEQLAEIYSAADVFVNPTLQDTFPTVNLEALACGTPVVTFDTGGSPEALTPDCGIVTKKGDAEALYQAIVQVKNRGFSPDVLRKRGQEFDSSLTMTQYLDIYRKLTEK